MAASRVAVQVVDRRLARRRGSSARRPPPAARAGCPGRGSRSPGTARRPRACSGPPKETSSRASYGATSGAGAPAHRALARCGDVHPLPVPCSPARRACGSARRRSSAPAADLDRDARHRAAGHGRTRAAPTASPAASSATYTIANGLPRSGRAGCSTGSGQRGCCPWSRLSSRSAIGGLLVVTVRGRAADRPVATRRAAAGRRDVPPDRLGVRARWAHVLDRRPARCRPPTPSRRWSTRRSSSSGRPSRPCSRPRGTPGRRSGWAW